MKKLMAMVVCLGMMVFGMVGIVTALPTNFTDTTFFTASETTQNGDLDAYGGDYVNYLEGFGDYVTWTQYFDFDPAAAEVLSGELTLYLRDNEDDTWNFCTWELGVHFAEDGSWSVGGVDTDEYSYVVDGSYLMDGTFTIALVSIWGDFYIDQSDLTITYEPVSAPVPEPATVMLVGTGLLGMIAFGRKRFSKKA